MLIKTLFILIISLLVACKSTNKPTLQKNLSKNDSLEKDRFGLDYNSDNTLSQDPINNLKIPEDSFINPSIENQILLDEYKKTIIDLNKVRNDESKVELYAKVLNSDSLIKVPNDASWPEETEISYNLIRDDKGTIVYFAEYPLSESGDWSIGYRYYFNDRGNTIIFLRESNFFNSECTDGVAKELSSYYFDSNYKLIAKEYELKSSEGNNLLNERCYFPYHYEYRIESNLNDLLSKQKMKYIN